MILNPEKLREPYRRPPMQNRACALGGGLGSWSKQGQEVRKPRDRSNLRAQPFHILCPGAPAGKPRHRAGGTAAPRVLLQRLPETPGVGSPSRRLCAAVRVDRMEGTGRVHVFMGRCCFGASSARLFCFISPSLPPRCPGRDNGPPGVLGLQGTQKGLLVFRSS